MEAKETILPDYLLPDMPKGSIGFDLIQQGVRMLMSSQETEKIGIGITTHNRLSVFEKTYSEIKKYLPRGAKLVVVDDASTQPVPGADYRFDKNVGIARAKNKCLELLEDCEHIFLFDDDCFPKVPGWYKPYIRSGENHLMYIFTDFANGRKLNDTITLYRDSKIVAYSHPRGPMLYFRRICLEKVGGMNPDFGKWGYEHPDLSNRIYNVGLTRFRFADVVNSKELFHSLDEHQTVVSTVPPGMQRSTLIQSNKPVYENRWFNSDYIPYKQKENVIITTYFTTVADPQRRDKWNWDKNVIKPLAESCKGVNLVVLNDVLHIEHDANAEFRYCEASINPYFQRWVSIQNYLLENKGRIDKVFCVDASDVVMLKNPFPDMQEGILYTGDEMEIVGCQWLRAHHPSKEVQEFIKNNSDKQLLNAGLCGGSFDVVCSFISALTDFYFTQIGKGDNRDVTDMGMFNLVARRFNVSHGLHVNTVFKADQVNSLSWFKHK